MNGLSYSTYTQISTVSDLNWTIETISDLNGDGQAEVFWRNQKTGDNLIWHLNGLNYNNTYTLLNPVPDLNWSIVTIADMNSDRQAEVFWRNKVTGDNVVWMLNNLAYNGYQILNQVADQNWEIQTVADLDGDGDADVFWRNKVTGENVIWGLNGLTYQTYRQLDTVPTNLNWTIRKITYLDSDSQADILWYNQKTGENLVWQLNQLSRKSVVSLPTVSDPDWTIVDITDFNNDGNADYLWRNRRTGKNLFWEMNGLAYKTYWSINEIPDLNWQLKNTG